MKSRKKKENLVNPNHYGFAKHCYYIVEVSFSKNHVVQQDIFYTGFIIPFTNIPHGQTRFLHAVGKQYKDAYSLKVVKEIGRLDR